MFDREFKPPGSLYELITYKVNDAITILMMMASIPARLSSKIFIISWWHIEASLRGLAKQSSASHKKQKKTLFFPPRFSFFSLILRKLFKYFFRLCLDFLLYVLSLSLFLY